MRIWPLLILLAAAPQGQAESSSNASPLALAKGTVPAQSFHQSVDFELQQNTILVPVRIGDSRQAENFIIDSGAPLTIAASLQRDSRSPTVSQVDIAGPDGGVLSVPVTRLAEMEIAGVTFRDVGGVVAWVEPPSSLACLSQSGLLGASLLQAAIWQIDFASKKLTVTNDLAGLDHIARADRIPFTRGDSAGSPRIPVRINSSQNVSMLVDLGFNGALAMPAATYQKTGNSLTADMPQGTGAASSTVFGAKVSTRRIGQLGELQIGQLVLEDFPVETGDGITDFHIGIEFLRNFIVTIDWQNDNLYLERRAPTESLYPQFVTYGFTPSLENEELVVGFLWADSPAARAGMRLGDALSTVGDQDAKKPAFEDYCAILNRVDIYGEDQSPIDVTGSRNGETMKWVLPRASLTHPVRSE